MITWRVNTLDWKSIEYIKLYMDAKDMCEWIDEQHGTYMGMKSSEDYLLYLERCRNV